MIKERFWLGILFIVGSFISYYMAMSRGMVDTFLTGGVVIGLAVAGVAYLIFSFESSKYLKHIESKKK